MKAAVTVWRSGATAAGPPHIFFDTLNGAEASKARMNTLAGPYRLILILVLFLLAAVVFVFQRGMFRSEAAGVLGSFLVIFGSGGRNNAYQPQNEFKLDNWIHLGIFSINKAVL